MKRSLTALAAAGFIAGIGMTPAIAQEEFKIGVLMSYSGISATIGASVDEALAHYMEEHGDVVAGRKIVLVRRDTTGPNPEVSRRAAIELITREKVNVIIGPDYTPNVLGLAPVLNEMKTPAIITGAASDGIVQAQSPYYLRTFYSVSQNIKPLAKWAYDEGFKTIVHVTADYGSGINAEEVFKATYEEAGGKIVEAIRVPLRSPEFSGYMQRIKDANPDAVMVYMPLGELPLMFLKAYSDAGLNKSDIKLIGVGDLTDETILDAAGDTALGAMTAAVYSPSDPSPENQAFIKVQDEKFGGEPRVSLSHVAGWDAINIIYEGLKAQEGKPFDPDAFIAFAKGREFTSPRGPIKVDPETGDLIQNLYFRKAEKVDGEVRNIPFHVVPAVAP